MWSDGRAVPKENHDRSCELYLWSWRPGFYSEWCVWDFWRTGRRHRKQPAGGTVSVYRIAETGGPQWVIIVWKKSWTDQNVWRRDTGCAPAAGLRLAYVPCCVRCMRVTGQSSAMPQDVWKYLLICILIRPGRTVTFTMPLKMPALR